MGHSYDKMVWRGENLVQEMSMPLPPRLPLRRGRGDDCPLEDDKTACETSAETSRRGTQQKPWELDPMVLDAQGKARGSRWRSGVTARRWWTGSEARQG